ncbi:hypothetical protein CEE36_08885 [candidate division TA06 bacterium B3_TA06]|uniref:Uncharacterized protein n=1 Tax=candidate division TA06 bacterium B3_TA06 TaxID=2012487 RepID=A0A532V1H4_UNCT6|nr:MAG: hypothetical protein CEE36_08885 [candidate division TA06 bacterium B3_TA06]
MTENELTSVIKSLKRIVKQDDWQQAGPSFILNNCKGRFQRALGIGLLWILAKEEMKSSDSPLGYETIMSVMQSMGVLKSQAYDSRRAAQVILGMMEDRAIWQKFSRDYLHRTAIYKLYALFEPLELYLNSSKADPDKKKFLERIEEVHTLTRNKLYLKTQKGTRFNIRGRIKRIKGKEIVVEVSDDLNFGKGQSSVVGSKASVSFKLKKEGSKKNS